MSPKYNVFPDAVYERFGRVGHFFFGGNPSGQFAVFMFHVILIQPMPMVPPLVSPQCTHHASTLPLMAAEVWNQALLQWEPRMLLFDGFTPIRGDPTLGHWVQIKQTETNH